MTLFIERLLPRSLLGRMFLLISASVSLFTLACLAFIHNHHLTQEVGDANESIEILADIVLPALSDSAVIGDYDTIQRTLNRAASGSMLASAEFVDAQGVAVRAESRHVPPNRAPRWLSRQVAELLVPISRAISVGGKNYGVLTLRFSPDFIAVDVWLLTRAYLLFTLLLLGPGLYLVRIPLKRIVADLSQAARFAADLKDHRGAKLDLDSTVAETRALAEALNRVSRELTERHQALADSEARKSAILAAGLDCFISIDDAGRIVDFNRSAEQTFGYRADEVRGRLMSEMIIPPGLREAHENGMERWRQTGEGPVLHKRIEISAMRRSGHVFPVELTVVPFGSGDRRYFAGFIRDITEQRKLESERERVTRLLKQSVRELEYQKFALDQHSIVSITDAAGNITYANDKFSQVSGYSRAELLGSNHRLIKSGLHPESFYREMWDSISRGKVWHGQIANLNKNGEIYWVASTIVPWLDDNGLPYQYVSIRTDITAQKQVEQALAEARLRELATGYEIQRSLLFEGLSGQIHGAQVATYTEPSQGIDGDFYAITRFGPDCLELLAGDVMGKGVPAALVGAAIKSTYHMVLTELLAQRGSVGEMPAPAEIVNAMHRNLTPRLVELNSFATLALYRFDRASGTLVYVNAGHTAGLLARDGSPAIEALQGDNLPIGVLSAETYVQRSVPVGAGDTLLMYSDGITDARDPQNREFGHENLLALFRNGMAASLPPTALLQSMRQAVRTFVGSDILHDDQTAIAVTLRPLRREPRGHIGQRAHPSVLVLPWRLDGLTPLRRQIGQFAPRMPAEHIDALTLASFEAATNILRHATPYFADATIACRIEQHPDELVVELIYPGPPFVPPHDPQPDFSGHSEGGFGLFIIQNCVDEVAYAGIAPGISSIRLVKRFPEYLREAPQ